MFNTIGREREIELYKKLGSNLDNYLMNTVSDEYKELKKVIVADCDGVISTNESLYSKDGKVMKSYGCYDKEMIHLMQKIGWEFLFVTADKVGYYITKARIDDLHCTLTTHTPEQRVELIRHLKTKNDIIVYIGDSLTDIPALIEADYAGTTSNAPEPVKMFCNYISHLQGGYGGFADVLWNIHYLINDKYNL